MCIRYRDRVFLACLCFFNGRDVATISYLLIVHFHWCFFRFDKKRCHNDCWPLFLLRRSGGLFKKFKAASLTKVLIKQNATRKGVVAAFHKADAVMNVPISEAAILLSLHTYLFLCVLEGRRILTQIGSSWKDRVFGMLCCSGTMGHFFLVLLAKATWWEESFFSKAYHVWKGNLSTFSNRWVARAFYGCQIVNRSNSIPRNGYNFGSDHVLWGKVVWAFDERDKIQPLHML